MAWLSLCMLWVLLSLAQPARAQSTGVPLGIDGDNGARTLWITRDAGGRVTVSGELLRLF